MRLVGRLLLLAAARVVVPIHDRLVGRRRGRDCGLCGGKLPDGFPGAVHPICAGIDREVRSLARAERKGYGR